MRQKSNQKKRVFVGLSGGVDSSVAAALLKKQGYDVIGIFIKGWHPEFLSCTWKEDRGEAMRVAATLAIPFATLDLGKEYRARVGEYLINSYRQGKTPNPDVACNRDIKFGAFYDWARAHGADFVATGHYARIESRDGVSLLGAGRDKEKDQSYFLWAIDKKNLPHILFPIGDYTKPEVRDLAREFNLPTAERPDSQGVCFLGQLTMQDFLTHYIKEHPGVVIDLSGREIGSHSGAVFYTLGQRHGFSIHNHVSHEKPHYIVEKDVDRNVITVAQNPIYGTAGTYTINLTNGNWFNKRPKEGESIEVRYRHRQPLERGSIISSSLEQVVVKIPAVSAPPALGQSVVMYRDSICLGGGEVS